MTEPNVRLMDQESSKWGKKNERMQCCDFFMRCGVSVFGNGVYVMVSTIMLVLSAQNTLPSRMLHLVTSNNTNLTILTN